MDNKSGILWIRRNTSTVSKKVETLKKIIQLFQYIFRLKILLLIMHSMRDIITKNIIISRLKLKDNISKQNFGLKQNATHKS
jgi:hypothetical protein